MSLASAFSLRRPARARLPLTLLAAALVGGAGLRADDNSPGSLDPNFTNDLKGVTTFTVLYEAQTTDGTPLIFAGGDNASLEVLTLDGPQYPKFSDPTFGSINRLVYTSALERVADPGLPPKILIGGLFGKSDVQVKDNEPAQNISRLTPEGVVDDNFKPGKGANDYVTSILPLGASPDGNTAHDYRIVVGGLFDLFNKESHKHLVRLERDGTVDESFADGLRIDDNVLALAEQLDPATGTPNGSILIAGTFNAVGGAPPAKIARLDINGVPDATFKPVIDTRVLAMYVQSDGKIVIGGDFTNINGTAVSKIARLNYDGSLDTTFSASVSGLPDGEVNPVAVYVLKPLGDGRLYVAGNFTQYNGVTRNYLARVSANGLLDTSFDPGTNIINRVQAIDIQPDDNKVLVAEQRSRADSNGPPSSLIRLNGDPVVPIVSITAVTPVAKEVAASKDDAPKNGKFQFRRNKTNRADALTVYFRLSGTATQGVDYRALTATPTASIAVYDAANSIYALTVPANVAKVELPLHPFQDGVAEPDETVTLTLVADPTGARSYELSSKVLATVTIKDE